MGVLREARVWVLTKSRSAVWTSGQRLARASRVGMAGMSANLRALPWKRLSQTHWAFMAWTRRSWREPAEMLGFLWYSGSGISWAALRISRWDQIMNSRWSGRKV